MLVLVSGAGGKVGVRTGSKVVAGAGGKVDVMTGSKVVARAGSMVVARTVVPRKVPFDGWTVVARTLVLREVPFDGWTLGGQVVVEDKEVTVGMLSVIGEGVYADAWTEGPLSVSEGCDWLLGVWTLGVAPWSIVEWVKSGAEIADGGTSFILGGVSGTSSPVPGATGVKGGGEGEGETKECEGEGEGEGDV
jgi:hypothetical protein